MTITLSAAEAKILRHLSAAPGRSAAHDEARAVAGMTERGYMRARTSLLNRRLIGWTPDAAGVQLTDHGADALTR